MASDKLLMVDVAAADLTAAGSAAITVMNPAPGGGTSAAATLRIRDSPSRVVSIPVLGTTLSVASANVVLLKNNYLVSDPVRGVLYASVPSADPSGRGNTVTIVNPTTGAIGASVTVGSEPGRMAISDDAHFLYVILNGAPSVARVDLTTFVKDLDISLSNPGPGTNVGSDLAVLPHAPHSVVVARRTVSGYSGAVVYDDATPRPLIDTGVDGDGPVRIAIRSDGGRVYGVGATSLNGVQWLNVTPQGLQREVPHVNLGINGELRYDNGLLYTNVRVVDPDGLTHVANLSVFNNDVRPDAAHGRVFTIGNDGLIMAYESQTINNIGSYQSAQTDGLSLLARYGDDGLAVGRGDHIALLRGTLIGP